jgi:prepilin peptidase CpaA
VYSANAQPLSGIGTALLGAATGLLLLLPSYLLRAMGAGDVKLMAAVGAFLGPMAVAGAAILTFVAGGLLSLSVALASGSMRRVARNLQVMILTIFTGRATGMALKDVPTTGRLPYAVAIACGTALQLAAASQSRWFFS